MAISSTLHRAPSWAAAARGLLANWRSRSGGLVRAPRRHGYGHGGPFASAFSALSGQQMSAAAADAQLLRVINMEISYAQQDCKNRNWSKKLGEGFPFEIQDKDGTNRMTLKRSDHKEQIEVEVFLPSPVNEAEENGEQEEQSDDGKDRTHTGNGVSAQYCIPLMVRIQKGAAPYLKICCSSYPNEFIIESLSFEPNSESGDSASHEAKLSNLPEEFQKALYSYLKSRGISTDITDFLHAYMINKECHEYLSWLRKLKGLVKN
uniref:Mitochondrial glycoprotein domain-containing protein n=1 Tax=Leersia perrieri TaxID=77586 RepID=A0A0D9WH89_9ORYZ